MTSPIPERNAIFHCKIFDMSKWHGTEKKVIPSRLESIRDLVILEAFQKGNYEIIGVYFLKDDVIIGKPRNFDPTNLKTLEDFEKLSEMVESWYQGRYVDMVLPTEKDLNELP